MEKQAGWRLSGRSLLLSRLSMVASWPLSSGLCLPQKCRKCLSYQFYTGDPNFISDSNLSPEFGQYLQLPTAVGFQRNSGEPSGSERWQSGAKGLGLMAHLVLN